MNDLPEPRDIIRRLASSLVFGAAIATLVVLFGTRDLESYETAFFSLDRGTAATAVEVLGHPVHTLALGLGVRLPLQGNLDASPAAPLAPYLPTPFTYWLLITLAVAAAASLVRPALEPLCGPFASWMALACLFWSASIVNYTIYDDWPETAVTYCAAIGCIFAPHALLALLDSRATDTARRLAAFSVVATVWGLIALSHAGHWALLALALGLSSAVALARVEHGLRRRLTAVALLAAASAPPVALQVADLLRELRVAGDTAGLRRLLEGPTGNLLSANLYPFGEVGSRLPFTSLVLALVSCGIGLMSRDARLRRVTLGAAWSSLTLGVAATTWDPASVYAPTITWALRDPAAGFAVLAAASAAASVRRSPVVLAALVLAALQGPAYATALFLRESGGGSLRWNQDMTPPQERASRRGLLTEHLPPGGRLALWPEVRGGSRNRRRPTTDFADAGYPLVTAWTKQRTMRPVVTPNELLFNQNTDLSAELLCNASAVRFLQLRYLLLPSAVVECAPWVRMPALKIDGWLDVAIVRESDDRVRALPATSLAEPWSREAALSERSPIVPALTPLPRSSLTIDARRVIVQLEDPAVAAAQAVVLPVSYDAAWRASSGQVHDVGGLVALTGIDHPETTVEFVPDGIAILRAVSMTLAQLLAVLGFLGLACAGRIRGEDPLAFTAAWERLIGRVTPALRPLRDWRHWLYLAYSVAILQRLEWRPGDSDVPGVLTGVLLPVTAFAVARLGQQARWHRWGGMAVLACALTNVLARGSQAAEALHDPLFWGLCGAAALGVSAVARRWRAAVWTASAAAGACIVFATVLPFLPDFESRLPHLDLDTARQSFRVIADQLGVLATVCLVACWVQAIAVGGNHDNRVGRTGAATRGALVAGLILVLAGAVPDAAVGPAGMTALGILLGLAEAEPRA